MIPIVIITPDPENSLNSILELNIKLTHPDIFIVTSEKSIGIEQIAKVIKFTQTYPLKAKTKHIIIPEANKITLVAQNALLKSLEESSEYIQYVLCVADSSQLLPTIISRSKVINDSLVISSKINPSIYEIISNLSSSTPAQKIEIVINHSKNRQKALTFVQNLTHFYRSKLHEQVNSSNLHVLKKLNTAHKHLQQNTNPQLTLEHLLFSINY